jgi:hypothetical protein
LTAFTGVGWVDIIEAKARVVDETTVSLEETRKIQNK